MASAQFEVWIKGRFKARFQSDVSPNDEAACVALLRSEARRHRSRLADVELRIRHRGGPTVYRGA